MQRFVGYVLMKRVVGTWRGLEFNGVSFGRFFFGLVRFEHVSDPRRRNQ
jgi:hypothetical protein